MFSLYLVEIISRDRDLREEHAKEATITDCYFMKYLPTTFLTDFQMEAFVNCVPSLINRFAKSFFRLKG